MDYTHIVTAVLGLVFVLGLAFLTITLLKWLQNKGNDFCLCRRFNRQKIRIIEQRRIDAKNSIVLMEVDNISYLLLVGGDSPLLLNQKTIKERKNK